VAGLPASRAPVASRPRCRRSSTGRRRGRAASLECAHQAGASPVPMIFAVPPAGSSAK
jgi:hypothetical protein